jgi:four helix bundle protein
VVVETFVVKQNLIVDLSYQFALRITAVAAQLRRSKEYDLASQLWRSGTSIGANIEEAQAAQSRADFRSKLSIAAKEARETHYWLRLAKDADLLEPTQVMELLEANESILKILTSIVKSSSK